ncbi:MAG: hypothetical protein EGQ20_14560 [Bacteroides oleiciplenus]|nr:hypothetical protein [Bacteroides oleiciplenus]
MESNSQLPYQITETSDWNYSFITKHGIIYHAYFIDFSNYHPYFSEVYTFNIEPETESPHPIDNQIAITIAHILKVFFSAKERAMIMICDNLDGKEAKRELLFSRWFCRYNDGSILKYDASTTTEDYLLYVSMYLHKENPLRKQLMSAFYDLVKNDFYPIE